MNGHVASVWFGLRDDGTKIGPFDDDNIVGNVLLTAADQSYIGSKLVMQEAYDLTYKIYSEEMSNNPLAIMMMHPHEDFVTDGAVHSLMERIVLSKLPSLTNTSLMELMEMPPSLLEPLIKMANKKVESESAAAETLLSDIEE